MFDLEQSISTWRKKLAAGGIRSDDVLDELEDHLREDIHCQTRAGATEEQAFETATSRVGPPKSLQTEFRKARPSWPAWLRIAYYAFSAGVVLISSWSLLQNELRIWEQCVGLSATLLACVYLVFLPRLPEALNRQWRSLVTAFLKFSSFVMFLWPAWLLLDAFGIVHFQMGIVLSMVLWCAFSSLGATVMIFSLRDYWHQHSPSQGHACQGTMAECDARANSPRLTKNNRLPLQMLGSAAHAVLEQARSEARVRGHDYIGTEHVLLALVACRPDAFDQMLAELHVNQKTVVQQIERAITVAPSSSTDSALPLTPRVRRAFQFAAREAGRIKDSEIGVHHLFLGLLRERSGVAGRVLRQLGLSLKGTRKELLST